MLKHVHGNDLSYKRVFEWFTGVREGRTDRKDNEAVGGH